MSATSSQAPDSLQGLHRIGADLESRTHFFEGRSAFKNKGITPRHGRRQGRRDTGDSPAGNQDWVLFHKRHSAIPGGNFNAAD